MVYAGGNSEGFPSGTLPKAMDLLEGPCSLLGMVVTVRRPSWLRDEETGLFFFKSLHFFLFFKSKCNRHKTFY